MFFVEKWIIYAVAAAILWGASYAASGPVLRAGMAPIVFYFFYSVLGFITAIVVVSVSGKKGVILSQVKEVGETHFGWLLFSLVSASVGALMTYQAVGAKNATLASLIEISYPFFVVIFTWIFFQEIQFTMMTLAGGIFVFLGVILIIWSGH